MGKLGKKMVDRIRAMLEEGYSKTETATELGLTRKTVASYAIARARPLDFIKGRGCARASLLVGR